MSASLLKPRYLKARVRIPKARRALYGHCYHAAEAVYALLGGKTAGWIPTQLTTRTGPHWFLRHVKTGQIVDPTAGQFACELDYGHARGRGFLTKQPSRRARRVIACAKRSR